MFIRNALALAACLAAAQPVRALELAADGRGDALLIPYYSTLFGVTSLFSVTNHDDAPNAVRVVIAEGVNGRVALAFNVYLAARDTWSAALVARSRVGAEPPLLATNDHSCTSVDFGASGLELSDERYTGNASDNLGSDPGRLALGQIELIELGTLSGIAAQLAQAGDCAGLRSRFADGGAWRMNPDTDVGSPGGHLSAHSQLVDVEDGIAFDIEAIAFKGFSGAPRHGDAVADATAARIYKPTLHAGQTEFVLRSGARIPASRAADAVSLLLMASRLEGPFLSNDDIDASTEWAVALPTMPAYVDNRPGGELPVGSPRLAPFASGVTYDAGPYACLPSEWSTIDRDGELGKPQTLPLCTVVGVVSVLDDGMPDPPFPRDFFPGDVDEGRLRASFSPAHQMEYPNGSTMVRITGLPVVAASLMRARNTSARAGMLAVYAMTGRVLRDP